MNIPTLTIKYYVEAGCLGSKGKDIVTEFCLHLQQQFNQQFDKPMTFQASQLVDIKKHHIEYRLNSKLLSQSQTERYLSFFDINLTQFEEQLDVTTVEQIEQFLGR